MKIEIADPPNIGEIAAAFPKRGRGVIYAYGDTIYNPSGAFINPVLVAHENAHGTRQSDPEAWWRLYIADPEFRYQEELYGHAAELKASVTSDRNANARLLTVTVFRLLAPFYEYGLSQRTFANAKKDLQELADGG
jgi:hypothetical protein